MPPLLPTLRYLHRIGRSGRFGHLGLGRVHTAACKALETHLFVLAWHNQLEETFVIPRTDLFVGVLTVLH